MSPPTFLVVFLKVLNLETICAIITPPGIGAIGIIRLSGSYAISIAGRIFKGKKLADQPSHTIHFGKIIDPSSQSEIVIDEVVVALFKNPHSYTGEDVVEISCHGSSYILQKVLDLCLAHGAALAKPGEFTQRAFLNQKLDLTQAEAVADLIAGESKAAHDAAMHQLRGGFSNDLREMREELIHFSALIELELDFSQEDVEFADRKQLLELLQRINGSTSQLINSFQLGNAVKNGVSVAIIGAPNAGKSTLLNALLNEDRAIVSEIAGTTRDTIEEVLNIDGILFRFIDTAGIREHTLDVIEQKGIKRSLQKAESADIVIHLLDGQKSESSMQHHEGKEIVVINKIDLLKEPDKKNWKNLYPDALFLSAANKAGIDQLKQQLELRITSGKTVAGSTIITNARHHSLLIRIRDEMKQTLDGLQANIPGDLLAHHIRQALHHIGELTGEVQVDRDILGAIFGKFCIGK